MAHDPAAAVAAAAAAAAAVATAARRAGAAAEVSPSPSALAPLAVGADEASGMEGAPGRTSADGAGVKDTAREPSPPEEAAVGDDVWSG